MRSNFCARLVPFLFVISTVAAHASTATGKVTVTSPAATVSSGSIHYTATATSTCSKGISAMGIYTAPFKRVYVVRGAKLDTVLKLAPGTYDTVVQEWDNCNSSSWTHVA